MASKWNRIKDKRDKKDKDKRKKMLIKVGGEKSHRKRNVLHI